MSYLKSISDSLASTHRESGPSVTNIKTNETYQSINNPQSDFAKKNLKIGYNLTPAELYEYALQEEGTIITKEGALAAYSGVKTGRSPKDKRIVCDDMTKDIWWDKGSPNFKMDKNTFLINRESAIDYLNNLDKVFIFDGFAGWDKNHRLKVRVVSERAYHSLFMHNMLIRPSEEELANFGEPDYTIYNAGKFPCNRYTGYMTSSTSIDFDFTRKEIIILGTQYAGEMKKGIFTVMHFLMPLRGVLSLHSSANENKEDGSVSIFFGLSGTGKCHGFDTPIMLHNGTTKMVQDIRVGDLVMGDDSSPRKVLSLGRGEDEMYEVTNIKGDTYTVNSEHILCLKHNRTPYIRDREDRYSYMLQWFDSGKLKTETLTSSYKNKSKEEALNELEKVLEEKLKVSKYFTISVKDYLSISKGYLKNFVGYKVGVEFPEKEVDIDPYIIGLWLGDGHSDRPNFTNQEAVILKYLSKELLNYDCYLSHCQDYTYRFCSLKKKINSLKNILRDNNLINNKHIPIKYKYNSRSNRLKLLAGLIDTDGYYDPKGKYYEITQKNNKLSEDIEYLSRSLGFSCYSKKCKKSCMYKGDKREGEYNRMNIYGNKLEEIPVLCPRKKAIARKQIKDPLCSQIKIKPIGKGKYYGFELDGNHQYLLGNFIVTHNTTLSADPGRYLIGDDEHCWTNDGIFNIEGGCYAKCIDLSPQKEPEIYDAIKFGALLENVKVSKKREIDFSSAVITQNTRLSYPIHFIKNAKKVCTGVHAKNIILLTCDAFGILPPVSKLNKEQAMYYFISGYTSKIAGTEDGINEPEATFSSCFGEAFIVHHPLVYAKMLAEKMEEHNTNAWLINTGWIDGKYGEGSRCPLKYTRAIVDVINNGTLQDEEFYEIDNFKLAIPKKCKNVDPNILNPRNLWKDKEQYDKESLKLAIMFKTNFDKYSLPDIEKYGPVITQQELY